MKTKTMSGAALAALALVCTPGSIRAAEALKVDIGNTGQLVQEGFEAWSPGAHGATVTGVTKQFGAFGGVTVSVRNEDGGDRGLGIRERTKTATGALGRLIQDAIKQNPAGGLMRLVFSQLKAGQYRLTTYHHDATGVHGTMDLLLTDADATDRLVADEVRISTGTADPRVTTASFLLRSDGVKDVYVRMLIGSDANNPEVWLNGFVLESAALPAVGSGTLLVHVRADAGVTADENGVTLWKDQSANGFEFTPFTAGMPLLETNLAGAKVLRFNGDALLKSTVPMQLFPTTTSGLSLFAAFSAANTEGQRFILNWGIKVPETNVRGNLEWGYDTGNKVGSGNFGLHLGCGQGSTAPADTILSNQFAVLTTTVKSAGAPPANVAVFKNGVARPTELGGPGGCLPNHAGWLAPGEYSTGEAPLDIGGRDDTGAGTLNCFHEGDLAEMIVYQGTLSDADRAAVEQYLGVRYGINTTPTPVVLIDERCVKIRYSSAAFEFGLENSSSLSPANWSAVTNKPVLVGNAMEVIIPHVGTKYYRLRKP
jgi:hypothetical protein